jgi:transcriptional regulator with XRE-family HTH domain
MNGLLEEELREEFQDEDARYAYVEAFLNASVAAQIKKSRGNMSQQELADKIGTKQSGVSRLENVNYSSWKVETLRKLARAFGLRLRISFEEFGTLIPEIENFRKGILERRKFEDDPVFRERTPEPREEVPAAFTTPASAIFAELLDDISRRQSALVAELTVPMKALNAQIAEAARPLSELGVELAKRMDPYAKAMEGLTAAHLSALRSTAENPSASGAIPARTGSGVAPVIPIDTHQSSAKRRRKQSRRTWERGMRRAG